jgi:DNA-binding CsgD family transcriptional regulator
LASDEEGRIVVWNKPAEHLLGYGPAQVLGKPCHELLGGRDVFGNRFCCECCALGPMICRHEAIHSFVLDVHRLSGDDLRVAVSIVVVPGPRASQHTVVHLLQPLPWEGSAPGAGRGLPSARALTSLLPPANPPPLSLRPLSLRELEVLRLLADGRSNEHIADSLFISVTTVRNHIQNILRKLEVHSKLEAVALAFRSRLI